ncbi:glycosyltransferase [Allonocardiopsis opalescens]|uniref:UDP:flavonoid glycosyltransferase YjiC (YdhE family) n=1 Tax=Allonocardiopsis opalescens TaxID=1144618 RepID=A0A2T0PZE9_9ACTN|nr:glycosyltransferase [Allonocardiopsis opalescens]PRX96787.1 UDP:flavonoid glycosyltransferase YjiC (YdhE family) [Allonocardiopsis opalescens]
MRIVIVAVGSRGDVAPYTGLGLRLREAGHDVAIAAHAPFADYVRSTGLGFSPLPMDLRAELDSREGWRVLRRSPLALARFARMYAEHATAMAEATAAAAEDAELLMLSAMGWMGLHVAEGMGIPSMGVFLQPMDATAEFPPSLVTTRSLGGWGNAAAARVLRTLGQRPFRSAVRALRARYGLPDIAPGELFRRLEESGWPNCYGFSPAVVPRPADWPPGSEVVGYWWPAAEPGWRPPSELADFLAAGPPPVFVGFGSMTAEDGAELGAAVAGALRRAGVRGVVQAGWAGLAAEAGDDVIAVGEVPHGWLFPRMAAVVHHAGAGTTAAALRAGVPAVPVPAAADQPFWADRITRIGVSPGPVPFRRVTAERLGEAVRAAVTERRYREQAGRLADIIATEDGAGSVLRVVDALASRT